MSSGPSLIGRYVVLARAGSGCLSEVFHARSASEPSAAPVAIQIFLRDLCRDENFVFLLEREAKTMRGLEHPNILGILDYGRWEGACYLVREYFPHRSLLDVLAELANRGQRLDPALLGFIGLKACEALQCAHSFRDPVTAYGDGVFHGGFTPESILLSSDGKVKVRGFGLSPGSAQGRPNALDQKLARVPYFSPESVRQTATPAGDLFSLGVLLWECLAEKALFSRAGTGEALSEIPSKAIPPVRAPAELARFVSRLLERDEKRRFSGVAEAKAELKKVLRGLGRRDPEAELAKLVRSLFGGEAEEQPLERTNPQEFEATLADELTRASSPAKTTSGLKWVCDLESTELDTGGGKAAEPKTSTIRVEVRTAKKKPPAPSPAPTPAPAHPARPAFRPSPELLRAAALFVVVFAVLVALPGRHRPVPVTPVDEPRIEPEVAAPETHAKPSVAPAPAAEEKVREPASQASFHELVEETGKLAQELSLQGYDVSPIGRRMSAAGKLIDERGESPEARKLVEQSLEQARSRDGLRKMRPPGTEEEIKNRLQAKMQELQSRVSRFAEQGRDPGPIEKKMSGFEPLMRSGEVIEAEKLLDEALELAR